MRAAVPLFLAALALPLLFAGGCAPDAAPPADVCAQAMNVFTKCGVTLPLLSQGSCTGAARAVARCVADHATNCEELASLQQRIDACVQDELDGGNLLPPAEDLPLPALADGGRDASRDGAGTPKTDDDAGADAAPLAADSGVDAAPDAGPARDDAGSDAAVADSGAWTGLDAAGSISTGVEKRFATPTLPVGTYTFTMTGTGDADLYVKRTTAPTTRSYDCRPFLTGSDEQCVITLLSPDVIHVMVRGAATPSTFTLQGR